MVPVASVAEKAMQLLAADAATLAPAANANEMVLINAAFTPGPALVIGDLSLADFDGSTPLDVGVGTQPEGLDPATGDPIITIKPPAGGWRWETTGVTNLPQTIWGVALTTDNGAALLATALLPVPITLSAVNQVVQLDAQTLRQLAGSIS